MNVKDIPLPDAWPDLVRKAMLHVASLARWNMIYIYAMSDNSDLRDVRSASLLDRRDREIALLKEEMRIKDIRMARISAKNRPHYPPIERMSILVLKAGRGWNLRQTAKATQRTTCLRPVVSKRISTRPSRRIWHSCDGCHCLSVM